MTYLYFVHCIPHQRRPAAAAAGVCELSISLRNQDKNHICVLSQRVTHEATRAGGRTRNRATDLNLRTQVRIFKSVLFCNTLGAAPPPLTLRALIRLTHSLPFHAKSQGGREGERKFRSKEPHLSQNAKVMVMVSSSHTNSQLRRVFSMGPFPGSLTLIHSTVYEVNALCATLRLNGS